jgi:hypothetical protein
MKRIFLAVMYCTINQPKNVISLGIKVRDLLFANVVLFATPPIVFADYKAQLDKALAAQAKVDKGQGSVADTSDRNTQVLLLFLMLNPTLLYYVNQLYKGNKDNILASGFFASDEPNPREAPPIPVIRKMLMTDLAKRAAKVYLEPFPKPGKGGRGVINFILQIAIGEDLEENYKTIVQTTNSHKLLIEGLDRGKEIHVRVCAWNARGMSLWSPVVHFIPAWLI